MDFAKKQLTKHGWKDGSGLGKSESGIKEAIKVKIKNDNKGVGHDAGEEFTFHWWDHVFNKAASNIHVQTTEDGVEVRKTETTERSKSKKLKTYDNKDMLYGKFVKGSTLSGGTETEEPKSQEQECDDEVHDKPVLMPANEEEILRKCGGRTAHKGARHGLKLNGKLYRIEQQEIQEQLMLDKLNSDKLNSKSANQTPGKETLQTSVLTTNHSSDNITEELQEDVENIKSKKKKKKKNKSKELTESVNADEIQTLPNSLNDQKRSKKSKKKKRSKDINVEVNTVISGDTGSITSTKGEKKKRKAEDLVSQELIETDRTVKKKKKKHSKERDS